MIASVILTTATEDYRVTAMCGPADGCGLDPIGAQAWLEAIRGPADCPHPVVISCSLLYSLASDYHEEGPCEAPAR